MSLVARADLRRCGRSRLPGVGLADVNYAPRLIKTLTFDKAGKYEFQPKDYPGLVYVRATVTPASEGQDGRCVLELWGWDNKED